MEKLLEIFLKTDEKLLNHDDLVVQIGDNWFENTFDSYFLALDASYKPNDESIQKTRQVLMKLLDYWKENIQNLANHETCYLPIDFSDQSTGCFKVTRVDNHLVIVYGYSRREGWSVSPSSPGDYSKTVNDFAEDHSLPQKEFDRQEFIDSIKDNIDVLKEMNDIVSEENNMPPVMLKILSKASNFQKKDFLSKIAAFFRRSDEPINSNKRYFNVPVDEVLTLVDEAWGKRGNSLVTDPGVYVIPMGRVIGIRGETSIKIIVEPGTARIKTAYPID